jgi:hypothetical protein
LIDLNDIAPPEPRINYDLGFITERLRDTAADWVPRLFSAGKKQAKDWRIANINGDAPGKSGSCVITLEGQHAGDWYDFDGTGQGGGPLSTLEKATGLQGRALFAHAAELVGWTSAAPQKQMPRAAKPDKDPAREIAIILSGTQPITGTLAETYLRARGLTGALPGDLLFHPDLANYDNNTGYPAMIAIVRDMDGTQQALHRTYLKPDGSGKADVPKPKKMLGSVAGGAVRLAPIGANGVLGLAEGIETALAVMTARPDLPVWAALSASGLEKIRLPVEVKRIVILADHDASGAGQRAAETLARRLVAEGRECAIAMPEAQGDDFNDLLTREGVDAIRACLIKARSITVIPPITESPETPRGFPIGFRLPDHLSVCRADDGDLKRSTATAWSLLLGANNPPWIFRVAGQLSWLVEDDDGLPMVLALTEDRLRYLLAHQAYWVKKNRADQDVPAHPPGAAIKGILATPNPDLPVLAGIVTAPVFGRNGALLTKPGYHGDARLFYRPVPGFYLPPVPDLPTPQEIAAARSLILDELLGEFPFTSEAERAHAVALLLLGFVRSMIDGPTPLHLIEKPSAGTGATLMVDVITLVLTGTSISVMTESDDDEEWRKRLTAKLRQAPMMVLIDNLSRPLDASAFAAALTAPYWEDRVLGASEMVRFPIRCIWIATGNNPEFSNEMARRLVRIRLDARVDQPWRRGNFRHPDLRLWVQANRAKLVAACLTLCRAWIAAGKPACGKSIGSYESWAQVIGGILETAGIPGFLDNIDEMMNASDGEGAMWRSFVRAWWDRYGTAEVGTGDLYEIAVTCEPALPLGTGGDRSQKTRLGKALGRMRDKVFQFDGYAIQIEATAVRHNTQRWKLSLCGAPQCDAADTEERPPCPPSAEEQGDVGDVRGTSFSQRPHETSEENQDVLEKGGRGGRFSIPHAHARTHARAGENPKEETQKRPPCPQRPPSACDISLSEGGGSGGRQSQPFHVPTNPPDWLKEAL